VKHEKLKAPPDDATFRASVVGASEVAALFDASPWLTPFELWHRKNGTIDTPEFNAVAPDGTPENERIYFGVKLEPLIIEAACERWGYTPLNTPHILDNGKGLGGHPDQIVTDKGERVVLEVKTADWLVAKKWGEEPPLNYLLQNMSYQGLAGCVRGDMIVLVGGNELRCFQYAFRPKLYAEIERRVADFWKSVRDNKPPRPDFTRDKSALSEIYNDPTDTLIDLRLDNRMPDLTAEYLQAKAWQKQADTAVEAAQAEILEKLGNNTAAMVEGYSVRVPIVAGKPDAIITPDMVGDTLKGRKAHRRFYIKEMESK
jgi:predicted phage-related endonuclease